MVNKKIVIISSIVALIIVGTIVGLKIQKFKTNENINYEQTNSAQNIVNNTESNNEIKENTNTQNEVSSNIIEQNQIKGEEEIKSNNSEEKTNNTSNNEIENEENTDEIAINLVKKQWGKDDTVYYTIDNQKNDTYTISVRSKSTTEQLAEYDVNINDKTVVIK